jgi:hypothetical protein
LLRSIVIVVLALAVVLGGLYVAMAERVEVVKVHTRDAAGATHTTRVWVVDDPSGVWLRTGADNDTWLARLRANPGVDLERRGIRERFTAVVLEDDATVARVNALTLEKYGWSEELLRAVTPSSHRQVAIRLDRR